MARTEPSLAKDSTLLFYVESSLTLQPAGKKPFNKTASVRDAKVPVNAMVITNHRAKNLGDMFSIHIHTLGATF